MSLGPVMLGLEGIELSAEERDMLRHPQVGGVILFARNYSDPDQLERLCREIHDLRQPRLIVAVDQEGGRVQRFRNDFSRLPPVRRLGELYDEDPQRALQLARASGWLMAVELRAVGVDLSFAPVLDLDREVSGVIGDRAFHREPCAVAKLASAYVTGMGRAGMEATGKHFPGHGSVAEDSHLELPVDRRSYAEIERHDLLPFRRLCQLGIAAFMAAHVLYPEVDSRAAGFSRFWIGEVLRKRFAFQGAVFSDDLDMAGARMAGSPEDRALSALEAGCDMVLVCNDRHAAVSILQGLEAYSEPNSQHRLARMRGRGGGSHRGLRRSEVWQKVRQSVADCDVNPLLGLHL